MLTFLESKFACDVDACKDDVVARLFSLVDSASELEAALNAFRFVQSSQLASQFTSLLSSLICRVLRWAQICRRLSCSFLKSESVSATKTMVSGQAEVIRNRRSVARDLDSGVQSFLNSL